MTEPMPSLPNVEQAQALARIEVKLDNALESQREHKSTLDRHSLELVDHGTRLTRMETRVQAENEGNARTFTGKQLAASVAAAGAAMAGVVTTVLRSVGKG